jgi:endonuclease VIII
MRMTMPEGPEIRRARDELAAVLEKKKIKQIAFAFNELKKFESVLTNTRIKSIEAKGKAMLIHLSNGKSIYSHNQLYGRWIIVPYKQYPETKRQLRLQIHVNGFSALLYSASEIMVLSESELTTHPYLSQLGLELLSEKTTKNDVYARLLDKKFSRRCLMSLLQDQKFLSGLGNYLCCEALHVSAIDPQKRLCDLTKRQINQLAGNIFKLIWQSYKTSGITNSLTRAKKQAKQGVAFEDYRFHVYRRAGLPCYRCGGEIIKENFCGRMGYACCSCQV